MSVRAITIAAAVLAWVGPAAAQERGTVEFGAFGSAGFFDRSLTLHSGFGGGGRVGVYLDPRWALEFEKGEMRADRTLGLSDVNVGILAGRLVATPIKSGALSILLGAGAGGSTETNFLHSYSVSGLVGAKIALSDYAAIRIDGIADFLANNSWKSYQSVHVGLSFYRSPSHVLRTVEVPVAAAPYTQRPDSVSAEEQARRRRAEREYRELRDSLNQPRVVDTQPASSAAALATMEERVQFHTDRSDLSPEATAILDAKVLVFRANPAMHIIIVGNADHRASDAYNMGLGGRRSAAAKAYLVAQGIDPVRIEITSEGERDPLADATGSSKEDYRKNRRDEFRLLVGSDYLAPPRP